MATGVFDRHGSTINEIRFALKNWVKAMQDELLNAQQLAARFQTETPELTERPFPYSEHYYEHMMLWVWSPQLGKFTFVPKQNRHDDVRLGQIYLKAESLEHHTYVTIYVTMPKSHSPAKRHFAPHELQIIHKIAEFEGALAAYSKRVNS